MHAEILKSALQLPEADRLLLATELIDSIAGEPPGLAVNGPQFEAELNRRFGDPSRAIPWEEVRRQLENDIQQ